ncbi:hypothetical protein [Bradyrhizobium sp.]|uniref:hypothetical protein n=1 Tax=Bradyrhizobium sp. TaxID=376 RepID=UPI003C7313CB
MAAIANPAAAPGQWTPSPFKSGKPGPKSMLRLNQASHRGDHSAFKRKPALGLDPGVDTGSRK